MGMMGMFKWLRKDIIQRDRPPRTLSSKFDGLNNEAYRNALHAFIERRRDPSDSDFIVAQNGADNVRLDLLIKNNYENDKNKNTNRGIEIPGVPHVPAPDIFEIGWVAGTEDRYVELIYAEWHHTRVSLRRKVHPGCKNAVRADLEVLSYIRHPNVLLLMGTTQTEDNGLVAIFESVDCTLFNYMHEQGERIPVQGVAKCIGNLSAALKHAHMRGYIHSAISPHCIFLASTGMVKIGGWELATIPNASKSCHDYDDRLRSEIYRWMAPEQLTGHEASEATDVFSLTLLMWEMCTMNIPWANLNRNEVKRQYTHYRRGVVIDLYNFPPLLNNLLDAGLQLDVTRRTLDMGKMGRYLRRLEIQYEDDEPIFIEQMTNNNKPSTPPIYQSPLITRCTSAESPRRHTKPPVYQKSVNDLQKKSPEPPDLLEEVLQSATPKNANFIVKNMRTDHTINPRTESTMKLRPEPTINPRTEPTMNLGTEPTRNLGTEPTRNLGTEPTRNLGTEPTKKIRTDSKNRDSRSRRTTYKPESNLTDEEVTGDPRINMYKLRNVIARQRESFFKGSAAPSSEAQKRDIAKTKLLTQIRSKDYEPHKPASHKTSLELKVHKSPTQYSSYTKPTETKAQKPYSNVPSLVKESILHPQVLNPDATTFFETSLWRREKEICISKMRKDYESVYTPKGAAKGSSGTNDTYTISDNSDQKGTYIVTDTSQDVTSSTMERSKSFQALGEALDRATDLVKTTPNTSTTPIPESPESNVFSPIRSPKSFADDVQNSRDNESIFDELHTLNALAEEEMKNMQWSDSGETFVVIDGTTQKAEAQLNKAGEQQVDEENCQRRLCSRSGHVPDKFREKPVEKHWGPEALLHESVVEFRDEVNGGHGDCVGNSETVELEKRVMSFSRDRKEKRCHTCKQESLARRLSLPAQLGKTRNLNDTPLGKLPTKKIDLPDNTVEDIYIDDEFSDHHGLAINMVLFHEEEATDDEYLSDLLETPNNSHECNGCE